MWRDRFRRTMGLGVVVMVLSAAAAFGERALVEPARTPVFDIPKLSAITIDGKADDWGADGFKVEALAPKNGKVKSAADLDAHVRLGWNDQGLLVLVTVRDDQCVESDSIEKLWQNDCVELWLAERRGGSNLIQAAVAPGMDVRHTSLRTQLYDRREDPALQKMPPAITAARSVTGDGYVLEASIPWSDVGVTPSMGVEVGFQCSVDDSDAVSNRAADVAWYPGDAPSADTMRMHRLRLAKAAGTPVVATGRAFLDGVACTRAIVVAVPELAGKSVALRLDGKTIATGMLEAEEGRACARLKGLFPVLGTAPTTAEVLVERRVVDAVAMPDADAARAEARATLPWVFHPFCFTGAQLPDGGFENPVEAENAFGPYTERVTYYDTTFKPVTSAARPGRYGAMVEIRLDKGTSSTRVYTLYRLPKRVDWHTTERPVMARLPEAMGIPDAVVKEQATTIGNFMRDQLVESLARSPDSAVMLAWLSETAPGTLTVERTDAWSRNARWIHDLQKRTGHLQPLRYVAHVPEAAQKAPGAKHPAILFLHGSGERDIPLEAITNQAIFAYARTHADYPFIVIAPQCPPGQWWEAPALEDTVADVLAKYPIDPDRLYLTGLSMGGFGCWMLATAHPDWFAAVVPICGGGDPEDVERIKDLPVWDFHGAKDSTVAIRMSNEMVEALRKAHGRVRYTVYSDGGHNVWAEAYGMDALYTWLQQQVRGKPVQPPATEQGATPTEELPLGKP